MANKNILTYGSKLSDVQATYFSPSAVLVPDYKNLTNWYCFLSKVDSWTDDQDPPVPTQDQRNIKNIFNNMFVAKQLLSNNISPVIRRVDWTTGTTYDYYQDDVDMLATDVNGYNVYNFYIKNKYDQIFKCLWNNNGGQSTVEPYFEPGTFSTLNIFTGADGYKWKYMYTIDTGAKLRFLDGTWMPIPATTSYPNPLLSDYGYGAIEVVNVTNSGNNYFEGNTTITVTISGDGSNAAGEATVNAGGHVTDVTITNPGANYSYANVTITAVDTFGTTVGSDATAVSAASPVGGHGAHPIGELGCSHVMLTCEFNGDEELNGTSYLPTTIDFYQLGIVINPTTKGLSPETANGKIYKLTTDLVFAPGFDTFELDEVVYQGNSLETATFTGKVLYFDAESNVLNLINTNGTPVLNSLVYGNSSKASRILLNYNTPDFVLHSGYITYIENRSSVQRSTDGIEQVKIVLGY